MKNKMLQGTGVALVTPFKSDKSVDYQSLENLVNFVIEGGVEYLVVLGTTAETATLTQEEKEQIKATITKTNKGRVPMVLGIGGNNTASVVEAIQNTDTTDYQAILSVTPYYNKPSQEGLYQHYKAIAQSTNIPILLYNVPGRTGVNMTSATTLRLANDFPNIIGIKEASGNIVQIMEILKDKPSDFLVISGDDATALPSVFLGADGVISVMGQGIPKEFSQMIRYGLEGNLLKANPLQHQMLTGFDLIFREGNPVGIKSLLNLKGISSKEVRLPLVSATENLEQLLKSFLNSF